MIRGRRVLDSDLMICADFVYRLESAERTEPLATDKDIWRVHLRKAETSRTM